MNRLFVYMKRYPLRYAAGSASLFCTATLVMAIPVLTQRAVDTIRDLHGGSGDFSTVAGYALVIAVVALLQAMVRTVSRVMIFNAGRDIEYDIRNDLFDQLQRLPQSWYQHQRTGDLMSRLVNDIGAVRLVLGPGVLTIINTPLYCAYAFTLMILMDPRLTVAAVLPFPLLLWVVKRYSHRMMDATVRTQERLADMSSFVQENLNGIHVLKSYVREEERARRFAEINERFKDESMDVAILRGKVFPFVRVISSLGVLAVLYYGGILVVAGDLTLGQLVAFIAYLHILAWPIMALGWMIAIYQRGKAAMQRLSEILDTRPTVTTPESPARREMLSGEIRFDHVGFAYDGEDSAVLRDIDLHVPPGGTLGIIGRTGSGKSTLATLIPRLFDVSSGRILVDGVDVREWDLHALRSAIGFVPQDPFLFSSSIEANIGFGRDVVSAAEMTRLVEMAGLDADLAEFPHGMETQVGERGVTMSGGQKQRLTIARAIARDPRILILDDALSSVDSATEKRILDELDEVMKGRSTIIVSHRVTSMEKADRIAVIDDGRIAELGSHDELVARGGIYAQLVQRQLLTEELEAM